MLQNFLDGAILIPCLETLENPRNRVLRLDLIPSAGMTATLLLLVGHTLVNQLLHKRGPEPDEVRELALRTFHLITPAFRSESRQLAHAALRDSQES